MIEQNIERSVTGLSLLCEVAAEYDIDIEACLTGTDVTLDQLQDSDAKLTFKQELHAVENILQQLPNIVGLGIQVGKKMHVNAFGIWGFAIQTSPDLRTAIMTAIDYIKLSAAMADLSLVEQDGKAKIIFDTTALSPVIRPYVVERHVYVSLMFIRELMQGQATGLTVETSVHHHNDKTLLSDLFNAETQTNTTIDAVVFSAELLDTPLPKSDPATLHYCLQQCEALIAHIDSIKAEWTSKVRDTVIENIHQQQRIELIAEKLAMTERTLRRRLAEEGTSFRDLYTDTRLNIARELLETTGLNVETVAWRVGYAESASFVHAFVKRFGFTPGKARTKQADNKT